MNSSPPQDSMNALMEAVNQVTAPYAFSQPAPTNFFIPGPGGKTITSMAPLLARSVQMNAVGGMMNSRHLVQTPPLNNMGGLLAATQCQGGGPLRKRNHGSVVADQAGVAAAAVAKKARTDQQHEEQNKPATTKAKRLEQNRMAAVESRRRKKHMVEELQRSVHFYTKANGTLKSQNADLERQLLIAKQKMLERQEGKIESSARGDGSASTPETKRESAQTDSKPVARVADMIPSISYVNNAYAATFGNTSNAEMEKQAQQAQFSATQALYKSMGYPAGAARVAASTFSQFVGQTGIVPGSPPTTEASTAVPAPKGEIGTSVAAAALQVQQVAIPQIPVMPQVQQITPSTTVKTQSDEADYIQALNRFAMQQAAAASAAAAAANAAIQAVNLHKQMRSNAAGGSPTSAAQAIVPSLPISLPAGLDWPFQGHAFS